MSTAKSRRLQTPCSWNFRQDPSLISHGDSTWRYLVGISADSAWLGARVSPSGASRAGGLIQPKPDSDRSRRGHYFKHTTRAGPRECPLKSQGIGITQAVRSERLSSHHARQIIPPKKSAANIQAGTCHSGRRTSARTLSLDCLQVQRHQPCEARSAARSWQLSAPIAVPLAGSKIADTT
jgi:hypothetical protein